MNKSTIYNLPIFRNSTFRNPSKTEEKIGLWLDRIGHGNQNKIEDKLRLLGLYGAVQVIGQGGFFINTKVGKVNVEDGDIMLLFPDEPSLYYPHDKWKVKWFLWNGSESALLCQLGYLSPQNPVLKNNTTFTEIHSLLLKLNIIEDMGSILERKSLILSFIKDIQRNCKLLDLSKKNISAIEKIIRYINYTDTEKITVENLAAQCHLSPTHFRRIFKSYTGSSPKEYIVSCKIKRAKKLLLEGVPIKEIADTLGFCDVFHFMRTFKKISGVNPGKFD